MNEKIVPDTIIHYSNRYPRSRLAKEEMGSGLVS
jgi:hypothetical protein